MLQNKPQHNSSLPVGTEINEDEAESIIRYSLINPDSVVAIEAVRLNEVSDIYHVYALLHGGHKIRVRIIEIPTDEDTADNLRCAVQDVYSWTKKAQNGHHINW